MFLCLLPVGLIHQNAWKSFKAEYFIFTAAYDVLWFIVMQYSISTSLFLNSPSHIAYSAIVEQKNGANCRK